jgi:hypothetical protein
MYWPIITDALLSSFEKRNMPDNVESEDYTDPEHALKFSFIATLLICLPLMGISCFLVKETEMVRNLDDGEELDEKPARIWSRRCGYTATHCLTKLQLAYALALFFVWIGAIIPFGFIPVWARRELERSRPRGSWPNYLLTICYSASVMGRLVLTWLSDKVGRFNVFVVMTFITGALIMA